MRFQHVVLVKLNLALQIEDKHTDHIMI